MHRLLLSVFGAGYSPVAPGTCGSAVVAAVFVAAGLLSGSPTTVAAIMLVVAIAGFIVTIRSGDRVIAELGPDPGLIVSDEACGQALTYLWLWRLNNTGEWLAMALVGFLLFRLFDIVKVPPARQLERVPGAWGVLLDDVAAGIYANIVLQIVWRLDWLKLLVD